MMNPRSKIRGGWSLIELLTAMAIGSGLVGVLTVTMTRVMRANAAAPAHLQTILALGQLAEQFRHDVHTSARAEVSKESGQERLILAGGSAQIEYEITPTGLRRAQLVTGETKQREEFLMPDLRLIGWEGDFEKTGEVSLLLGRLVSSTAEEKNVRPFKITAFLRRDSSAQVFPKETKR